MVSCWMTKIADLFFTLMPINLPYNDSLMKFWLTRINVVANYLSRLFKCIGFICDDILYILAKKTNGNGEAQA